jgi:hypothetical protein
MECSQQADTTRRHETKTLEPAKRTGLKAHDMLHVKRHAQKTGAQQENQEKNQSGTQETP